MSDAPRSDLLLGCVAAVAVAGMAFVGILLLGSGAAWWQLRATGEAPPVEEPAPVTVVSAEPEAAAPAEPAPRPVIAAPVKTDAAEKSAAPSTPPAPAAADPAGSTSPAASPAGAEVASTEKKGAGAAPVTVSGEARVSLLANGRRYTLPSVVPSGRYTIEARFGAEKPVLTGTVTVPEGGGTVIQCNPAMGICAPR